MKRLSLIAILSILFIGVNAQDEKAKGILDKLSKKTATYTSMEAKFEYVLTNQSEGINETQEGSLLTKGDQYHLNIAGQQIISDGSTVWTVLDEAEEVQINDVPEDGEEEDYISPTKILTLWEKGFKYKYDKISTLNGSKVDVINLFPEQADDKSFHTIKLFVNQSKLEVDQIIIKGKDGSDFTYKILEFTTNQDVEESKFKFSNPDYDVIDLR